MPFIDFSTHNPLANYDLPKLETIYNTMSALMSEHRAELFESRAALRTRHITVAIENVYQSHNAAAVLRSCDCFGVQDVHIVDNINPFRPAEDVAVGSGKWVDYYRHRNIKECYKYLHDKGYKIVATLPHEKDTLISNLDVSTPIALIFGTELTGLSQEAIEGADMYVKIPMYGFTESFNISVSAALCLFQTTEKMRATEGLAWQLGAREQLLLKLHWTVQSIQNGEQVLRQVIQKCAF